MPTESPVIPEWSAGKGSRSEDIVTKTPVDDSFVLAPTYEKQLVDLSVASLNSALPRLQGCHVAFNDKRKTDPFADLEEQFGDFQSARKSCP